ncbi:MAG: SRPBCC domain-containing protein [Armatimonadetes bacterium]|nr:SRPBCC domain-containing protein [Armatimonadota bacterium]
MIEFFPIGDDGLRVEVFLPHSPERVFRAWADRDEFATWFRGSEDGHLVVQGFDFREGGGFEVTMVSGSGHEATLVGTYLQIVQDSELQFTWSWRSPEGLSPQMVVTLTLQAAERGTHLVIDHRPFLSPEARDMHRSGWQPCLSNLVRHLCD